MSLKSTQRITCCSSTKYSGQCTPTLSTLTGGSTTPHANIGPTVSDTTRTSTSTAAVHPPRPRAAPLCKRRGPTSQSAREPSQKCIDHAVERTSRRTPEPNPGPGTSRGGNYWCTYTRRRTHARTATAFAWAHKASSRAAVRTGARVRVRPAA